MTTRTVRCGAGLRILAIGSALILAGCDDSEVIQKDEVKAPDGYWTARAEVVQSGGPGNATLYTHVYLSRPGLSKPFTVLTLNDDTVQAAPVQMSWRDNRTLDISHFPDAKVEFQVVKAAGVTISVH